MKAVAFLLVLVLALSGCTLSDLFSSDHSDTSDNAGKTVRLAEGEIVTLSRFNARLAFVRKTSDSRCPVDVVCVWEGEATVLLRLSVANQPAKSFSISTLSQAEDQSRDKDGHAVKDTLGFRFTLLELGPYPDTRILSPGPSVLDLRVEKL